MRVCFTVTRWPLVKSQMFVHKAVAELFVLFLKWQMNCILSEEGNIELRELILQRVCKWLLQ